MKQFIAVITLFIITITFAQAQEVDVNKIYQSAIKDYKNRAYQQSAEKFTQILDILGIEKLSDYVLFKSAYVFASNNAIDKTLQVLNYLANDRLYSDIEKLQKQENFKPLYNKEEWKAIVLKISENKKNIPFPK